LGKPSRENRSSGARRTTLELIASERKKIIKKNK
jgi:hypothetical protein